MRAAPSVVAVGSKGMEAAVTEFRAKSSQRFTLNARMCDRGVRLVLESPSGFAYGDHEVMTLSWAEWERLVAWVAYQRAEKQVNR